MGIELYALFIALGYNYQVIGSIVNELYKKSHERGCLDQFNEYFDKLKSLDILSLEKIVIIEEPDNKDENTKGVLRIPYTVTKTDYTHVDLPWASFNKLLLRVLCSKFQHIELFIENDKIKKEIFSWIGSTKYCNIAP